MQLSDVRFLFDYDRWATRRVLDAAIGIDAATWSAEHIIDERGLGGMLVHQLGAHQRWRHGLSGSPEKPRPEREPLPSLDDLRARWEREWLDLDAWIDGLDDAAMNATDDGIPYWQMLAHVVNHGTQHRSEAAALLTGAGRSPGDLDLIFFAQERAGGGGAGG